MGIFPTHILREEIGHLVGGEARDIDDHVVVAGVVAGGLGEGLGVVLAGFVGAFHDFAGFCFVHALFLHQPFHAAFGFGDEEQPHGVGVVLEYVEAGAPHDDAGFLLGELLQNPCFLVIELSRVDFERFVGDGGRGAELPVEPAEVGPPAWFGSLDSFNFLFGEFEFFADGGEDFLAVDFHAEQFAQLGGDFFAARSRLAVDGDDEFLVCHIFFCYFQMSGQKYNFLGDRRGWSFRFQVSGV